jgi:hypothetical protein
MLEFDSRWYVKDTIAQLKDLFSKYYRCITKSTSLEQLMSPGGGVAGGSAVTQTDSPSNLKECALT